MVQTELQQNDRYILKIKVIFNNYIVFNDNQDKFPVSSVFQQGYN